MHHPGKLQKRMMTALGSLAKSASAREVVEKLAQSIALRFNVWISATQVIALLGHGPVPTWAPPYVPVGSVVGGTVIEKVGSLVKAPRF